MKTTEFIVEYAGIGEDAEAMSQDHEVQLARQECYHAARDAIALHHILKDVSEQEGLESWVSEKLTQAASNLKDVIEHLEAMRGGDGESGMGDIMHVFSMESAEQQYAELLGEGQINELNPDRYADYEYQQQDQPRQQAMTSRSFAIVDRATGKKLKSFAVRSEAERAAARMGGFSKVKVIGEEEVENDAEPITELDSSTMQSYLQKRKETPTPKTVHKAVNQANGVRSAHEKIHDKLVMKHAIAGGDTRVRESEIDEAFKEVPTHGKTGKPNPNHPSFAKHDADYKAHQAAMRPPRAPAQPKLTLNDVWRQVEHVVGQIFPDGDPIDWMAPWLEKRGYKGWDIGKIIDRAAKANGYTDMYDYWDQLKQQMDADNAYDAQMGEATAPRAKKPQMFRVDVPQGLRHQAGQAIKKLGLDVESSGYSDGSTTWSFAVHNNKFASAEQCTDAIRKAMGGYNEWLRVSNFAFQESTEQVDELSQGTLQSYVPKANRSREKATDDAMKPGGYNPKVADKMGRRAEFTMKAQNKVRAPEKVTELSKNTMGSYAKKANAARSHEPDDRKADNRGTGVMKALDKISGGPNKGNALKGKAVSARFSASKGGDTANKDRADFEKAVDRKVAKESVVKEDATGGATSVGGIATGIAGAKGGKPGTGKPKSLGNKVSRKQVQVGKGVY